MPFIDCNMSLNLQYVLNQSLEDVLMVTPAIVKEAAHKLKSGKGDPVFSFSSDCFKNASDILYDKLSILMQIFLVHGHVRL